jgi:hypothetical protein
MYLRPAHLVASTSLLRSSRRLLSRDMEPPANPPRRRVAPRHECPPDFCGDVLPGYSASHPVADHDGWITMAEAGRRAASEYGRLTNEQCLVILRIMNA